MEIISGIITRFFDLLVIPFGKTHQTLELVWLSLLTGVGMAYAFKYTSNQEKIRRAKDRFKACILEMRIYQDDLSSIFSSLFGALRMNVVYLAHTLRPLLVIIVPVIVVFIQMDERYGSAPLGPGDATIVTVALDSGVDPFATTASLVAPEGVRVDTGPVRSRRTGEIAWRVRVEDPGIYDIVASVDGSEYRFPLVAQSARRMVGHRRSASSFLEPLLHPSLPAIPDSSPMNAIRIDYPGASYPLIFWRLHWIVIFIIYSLVGAVLVKLLVGFEI